MLPSVALELSRLSKDPNVPFPRIRALIESEPLLAAQLLRRAQSTFYSRGQPISSLEQAMTRLGLSTLSGLFLQAALTAKVFRAPGYERPMEAIRKHSVVTAELARQTCRTTGFPDEYAYMCGLLHDVGMAACLLLVADVPRGQRPPEFSEVVGSIHRVHAEASEVLAKAWSLPPDVQLVVRHHHSFMIGGRVHPLAAAICLADWIAAMHGASVGEDVDDTRARQAVDALGLTEPQVKRLVEAGAKFVEVA